MDALKSIAAGTAFPARIAATTAAGYASASGSAGAKFSLFINDRRPQETPASSYMSAQIKIKE